MPVVTSTEVANSLGLSRFGKFGLSLSDGIMRLLKITDLNDLYDRHCNLDNLKFIDTILNDLGISVEISESDKKRLPSEKVFIAVANHPLGAIDGLIMLKILMECHPDAAIIANFLIGRIQPLKQHICPVNPFENRKHVFQSSGGIRLALQHLNHGKPLGIFPAGEVSQKSNWINGQIKEKDWALSTVKLIQKAKVPIVPIYFNFKNSPKFYLLAGIHHNLRTASLPGEVFNARNRKIPVRIGEPVTLKEQMECQDTEQFRTMLKNRLEILSDINSNKKRVIINGYRTSKPTKNATPGSFETIRNEFCKLENEGALLFSAGFYKVFYTKLHNKPDLLMELGRIREITFRKAGEGTLKTYDHDQFDKYYHHLILWDDDKKMIAGAYRLGIGSDIYKDKGLGGFYLNKLFHLTGIMHDIMANSIELGRSFILSEYQKKPTPLFLLWKGILIITQANPQCKYLIGAVSISKDYSDCSKAFITRYLEYEHLDPIVSHFVAPKKSFRYVLTPDQKIVFQEMVKKDFSHINKMIRNIEPDGKEIPVLIKKYLRQNAKVLGFNVDPSFNNSIDVLMYADLNKDQPNSLVSDNELNKPLLYFNDNGVKID